MLMAILLIVDAVYLLRLNIIQTRGKTLFPMALWLLIVGIVMVVDSRGQIL